MHTNYVHFVDLEDFPLLQVIGVSGGFKLYPKYSLTNFCKNFVFTIKLCFGTFKGKTCFKAVT